MSGVLWAAIAWPVVVFLVGLLLGRLLRSTDRAEERRRVAPWTAVLAARARPRAGDQGRHVSAAAGAGSS